MKDQTLCCGGSCKASVGKGDQIICVGIKHKWRAQRILASGQVTRITQVLKSSIEDLDMGCGGLGRLKKSGRFKFQRLLVSLPRNKKCWKSRSKIVMTHWAMKRGSVELHEAMLIN